MIHSYWPALMLLASGLVQALPASAEPQSLRSEPAFYIETYGEVRPGQDPEVERAHRVFEKVRAAADLNARRLPKLVVVRSQADPWAIALPSGHIVLSKEAVSICHRQASPATAEARLAFVLGHELAHLAHDDFWHHEVYSFLSQHEGTQELARFLKTQESSQDRELKADDKGFIYASIAGFNMGSLLDSSPAANDFFDFWLTQTSARTQNTHLAATIRADRHKDRLSRLHDRMAFFEFGVRLSHFDLCDDAQYFFQEFQRAYPGREVLNNLGFCQLQMARREMNPAHAYFYWMPQLLDADLRTAPAGTRGAGVSLKALRQAGLGAAEPYLNDAVTYLRQAAQADSAYLPARINLAIAYLYLGQPHQARAAIEEAREQAPNHPDLQVLEALTLYEQSESGLDLWPTALAKLEKLAAAPDASPAAIYNLARLASIRPRPGAARNQWSRLAGQANQLPTPIRDIVCREPGLPPAACQTPKRTKAIKEPWTWPVATDSFQRVEEPFLPDWKSTAFDWVKDKLHGHIYQQPDGTADVLELDHYVHMQVVRGENLGRVADLPRYCAEPLRRRTLAQGEVWNCDRWAALGRGDRVDEVWWVAK
jgi:hypothetical protein